MCRARQKVYETLDRMKISYDVTEHTAVFTIEEMEQLNLSALGEVAKNLFLRDDKKEKYYLILLQKDKKADLKKIQQQLDSRPLSFASEDALQACFQLEKGSVTPLGVLNDTKNKVHVAIDKDLGACRRIGVHPNENTATLWISPVDLDAVIKASGNALCYIEI